MFGGTNPAIAGYPAFSRLIPVVTSPTPGPDFAACLVKEGQHASPRSSGRVDRHGLRAGGSVVFDRFRTARPPSRPPGSASEPRHLRRRLLLRSVLRTVSMVGPGRLSVPVLSGFRRSRRLARDRHAEERGRVRRWLLRGNRRRLRWILPGTAGDAGRPRDCALPA